MKLPTDTSAAIRWRNLLGQRYMYLYPGSASTVLRNGGRDRHRHARSSTWASCSTGWARSSRPSTRSRSTPSSTPSSAGLDGNEDKLRQSLDDLAALLGARSGQRDEAIGRLVGNLDTVAGTFADRDGEIRTILDNLVAIATTFSENTDVARPGRHAGQGGSRTTSGRADNNRAQIDRILDNLAKIVTSWCSRSCRRSTTRS